MTVPRSPAAPTGSASAPLAPPHDCPICPRLASFRLANRAVQPGWFNGPVPPFGPLQARLLVVGLAPGLRGANRTGRPFTGDYAGDLLYPTLIAHGFARGEYRRRPDDGVEMIDCRITNAARCVPPENKPTPAEVNACRSFLVAEMAAMPNLSAILALGTVAHASVLAALGQRRALWPFAHGAMHRLPAGPLLADSYHCSRYNTNTGRLTAAMFEAVVADLRTSLGPPPGP